LADVILSLHLKTATPINREHATKVGVNYALLFVCCLLFHIAGTWSLPLIDRDEPRFAEASREMIQSSDYVVPHFNNQWRLDKPPLAYWAQVATYKIFGESDFSARFPSAIAAALAALAIFAWGSRIDGKRVGWWAAIIFTLSLQTFLHAKAAVADMWLVLFVTLAHWAGYELIWGKQTSDPPSVAAATSAAASAQQWKWWSIFYVTVALAFLAKGPIGWMPLLTVASTTFFASNLQLRRRFKFVRGILLMLAIVALWGVPALIRTHGEFFTIGIGRHVVARSFGAMEGHGLNSLAGYLLLLPFYFVTVFVSFFPWSIKLPWLVRKLWCTRRTGITDPGYSANRARDETDNYFISGIAIIFIIFTLVKTKLPHYTLPAFPLLSLLLARRWIDPAAAGRMGFLKKSAVTFVIGWLAMALFVAPFGAQFFPAWQLYRESRDFLRPEMQFGAVDYIEPGLVWYFRGRVKGFLTPLNRNNAPDFMATPGPRLVVMPTALAGTLLANHPENWKIFSTRGFNLAKGKPVDLTLMLKSD
jgi:4-amino-4-deoxy-L-arabinose transferase-like glycosyltransferase